MVIILKWITGITGLQVEMMVGRPHVILLKRYDELQECPRLNY
jgi:hypothetical protein